MANPFDQFDAPQANPFDQFDAPKPRVVGAALSVNNPPAGATPAPAPDSGPSWGSVLLNAAKNLPSSLYNDVAVPTYKAFRDHPLETLEAIPRTMVGALDLIPGPKQTPERQAFLAARANPAATAYRQGGMDMARAVGQDYANAYGNEAAIKNTLANHPGRVLLDATSITPLGEATLPGKVGTTVGRIGELADPLTVAGNALRLPAKAVEPLVSNTLGVTTGAGTDAVRLAANAGREGGDAAKTFTANMRGNVPVEQIVGQARDAVAQMRSDRADAYRAGMGDLAKDNKPLDFDPIEAAAAKANQIGQFKGQITEPEAATVLGKINDTISTWRGLDPTEYHTPVGIDALKRTIGNIRDSTAPNSPERVAADRVYNAIKNQIVNQAPDYAKTMEAYSQASNKINEASRTFSLGERATGDTAARKLMSAMRNNVDTNYGARGKLLNALAEYDPTLPAAIAGQSLNSLAARGPVGRFGLVSSLAGAAANPTSIPALAAFSPRLVGEAAYYGGKGTQALLDRANALRNANRIASQSARINALSEQP